MTWGALQSAPTAATWYQARFATPEGDGATELLVNATGLGRGRMWVNGNDVGRYWLLDRNDGSECSGGRARCATQELYHVPRSWLRGRRRRECTDALRGCGAPDPTSVRLAASSMHDGAPRRRSGERQLVRVLTTYVALRKFYNHPAPITTTAGGRASLTTAAAAAPPPPPTRGAIAAAARRRHRRRRPRRPARRVHRRRRASPRRRRLGRRRLSLLLRAPAAASPPPRASASAATAARSSASSARAARSPPPRCTVASSAAIVPYWVRTSICSESRAAAAASASRRASASACSGTEISSSASRASSAARRRRAVVERAHLVAQRDDPSLDGRLGVA